MDFRWRTSMTTYRFYHENQKFKSFYLVRKASISFNYNIKQYIYYINNWIAKKRFVYFWDNHLFQSGKYLWETQLIYLNLSQSYDSCYTNPSACVTITVDLRTLRIYLLLYLICSVWSSDVFYFSVSIHPKINLYV